MKIESKEFLPVEIVFHPDWWHARCGLNFGWDFFFDPEKRVTGEQTMRRELHRLFGEFGVGEANPALEPIIGPVHLAAGFVLSAIWGCKVLYYPDASPQVVCRDMEIEELDAMPMPNPHGCAEFAALEHLIEDLKKRFGRITGDIGWDGVQNLALDLVGQRLFVAYYTDPERVHRIFSKLTASIIEIVEYVRKLTGTSSITVNRSIERVDPAINLTSNCSVQMISNDIYEQFLLPYDQEMSRKLQPFGIHHCGNNMHQVVEGYAKVQDCCFFDVGWGADMQRCRSLLPEAFLNVRLSPVKIRDCTPDEVRADIERLLKQVGPLEQAGLCCINMDRATPDENVAAIYETAARFRRAGA